MSKQNKGRKRQTAGTHKSSLAKMLERMEAYRVRNHLKRQRK